MKDIIQIRAKTEKIQIDDEAISKLVEISADTSLRYALQLLTPSKILADVDSRELVTLFDVESASELFIDTKKSIEIIKKNENDYLS